MHRGQVAVRRQLPASCAARGPFGMLSNLWAARATGITRAVAFIDVARGLDAPIESKARPAITRGGPTAWHRVPGVLVAHVRDSFGGNTVARRRSNKRSASVVAARRAKKILEIKPGSVTVYTAYMVVFVRLLIVVAHTIVPGAAACRSATPSTLPKPYRA